MRKTSKKIAHKSKVVKPGEHLGVPARPYIRRNGMQPKGTDTYQHGGVMHTFDGKCHTACEDVR